MSFLIRVKHFINSTINIFYDDTNLLVAVSCLFGLSVVISSFALDIEESVFFVILSGDSQTVANLLSILYASIAIIMAISSSTQNLSNENSRWLLGMLKIIQQFRWPIISSISLVFLLFFSNSTVTIIETYEWHSIIEALLTFLTVSLTVHVIICTLILSLNMINYIKAQFQYSENVKVNYVIIDTESDFTEAFLGCVKEIREALLGLTDTMKNISDQSIECGTDRYLPANHPAYDLMTNLICHLNFDNESAKKIYEASYEKNLNAADRKRRTNAEMLKLISDLESLSSDFKNNCEIMRKTAEEFIGCSKIIVMNDRLQNQRNKNETGASLTSDDLSRISDHMSEVLTLISSNIIKMNKCFSKAIGDEI